MPDPADERDVPLLNHLTGVLSSVGSVVAPITVVSAMLFYFGYASSRAEYEYFGLDVDTIGLGTQDFVMRSPPPLLVPLLTIGLIGALLTVARGIVRRHIASAAESQVRLVRWRRIVTAMRLTGRVVLGAGVALVFAYAYLSGWTYYPLVTPCVIAIGAALVAYGTTLDRLLQSTARLRPAAALSIYLVLGVGLFWATATLAQFSGRGLARDTAADLNRLPTVILDTKERLYLTSPNTTETALPAEADQEFRYRYRNLRLLIQGGDRLFLVPAVWSASNSTLMVPMDDGVRVQFQFQNDAP